jgi:hypothetical protein
MNLEFSGVIWYWRGPAPWYFVSTPPVESDAIKAVANMVTYGWGVIPVRVMIGETAWETSLIPKDGGYLVPIKARIRKAEKLNEGDRVTIQLQITM